MECFIALEEDIHSEEGYFLLRADEARHAARSLRLREGDELIATTLKGICYRARVEDISEGSKNELTVNCTILQELPFFNEANRDVLLAVGLLSQPARFEDILEKTTEYGVKTFIPIVSERSEKRQLNAARCRKILEQAAKQVSRAFLPDLHSVTLFEDALAVCSKEKRKIFLFHEKASGNDNFGEHLQKQNSNSFALFIGPEGGFTEDEVLFAKQEFGAQVISLGERRLRAETAAAAACAIILCSS